MQMRWLITKARIRYLVAVSLFTALCACVIPRVGVEESNESMNAQTPAQAAAYRRFQREFGDDAILVLSATREDLLTGDGLAMLEGMRRSVADLPGVDRVNAITNMQELVHTSTGAEPRELIARPYHGDLSNEVKGTIRRNPILQGIMISRDFRTAAMVIVLNPDLEDASATIEELRAMMRERADQAEFHLTGILLQKYDVAQLIRRDQMVVLPLSALVLVLFLALNLRSFWGVVMPVLVSTISLTWTLALYSLAGLSLNAVTSLLPPVVIVLSVASTVHLNCAWRQADQLHPDPVEHALATVRKLSKPCFLTAATTAIGLISLSFSETPAVQQFGTFAALGVLIAFGVGITIVPICFTFAGDRGCKQLKLPWLDAVLRRSARLVLRRPGTIVICAIVVTIIGVAGIPRIRINTDIIGNVRKSSALYEDTMFIDQHLAGANSLEFVLRRRDGTPLNQLRDARAIARFQKRVRALPGVKTVIGPADLFQYLHRAEEGLDKLTLPADQDTFQLYVDLIRESGRMKTITRTISDDFRTARVSVRIRAVGTAVSEPLVQEILAIGRECFTDELQVEPTGDFYYMTVESNQLVKSQTWSFALALVLTMVAIGFIFRSWKFMFISIFPNIVPIVLSFGIMGYVGIDLGIGTAMIASVVIGLAVDGTIHYFAAYRRNRNRGIVRALARTNRRTGRALVIGATVLVLGFWTGCLGSFKETIYFSLMTGLAMIAALICDLLVLPATLLIAKRRKQCGRKS